MSIEVEVDYLFTGAMPGAPDGTTVTGTYRTTNQWNRLATGQFISHAYVASIAGGKFELLAENDMGETIIGSPVSGLVIV